MTEGRATPRPPISALLRHIERLQGERPWGSVLDAGTGLNSLRWVAGLRAENWTAVTGSKREAALAQDGIDAAALARGEVLVGNWADPSFLVGAAFDTVLADYLPGAVEGFAPYFQASLFLRLRPLVRGTPYVTGLEPYVPTDRPEDRGRRLLWEIGRFRDACVLMKGDVPYREYPAGWAEDQLARAGFKVRSVEHSKVAYKETFVNAQIEIAVGGLDRLRDRSLARALEAQGFELRAQALELIRTDGALRGC